MEVILKQDIRQLGHKNDVVKVKDGYARNYLLPRQLAVIANAANRKMAEQNMLQAAKKEEKLRVDAEALAKKLEALEIKIAVKAGEQGKIFGSITPLQVAEAIQKEYQLTVDPKSISFDMPVKTVGQHEALLILHRAVHYKLRFEVVAM